MKGKQELYSAFWAARHLFALAIFFSFFVNFLMLAGPLFVLLVYDRVLTSRSEETLWTLFIMVSVAYGLMSMLDYARRRLLARIAAQFQERLEWRVFNVVTRSGDRISEKDVTTVGVAELDGLRAFLHSVALISIIDFLWTPIFLVPIFFLHPALAWACLAGVACLTALAAVERLFPERAIDFGNAPAARIRQIADNVRFAQLTIATQSMSSRMRDRWLFERQQARDISIHLHDRLAVIAAASKHFRLLLQSFILAYGAFWVLEGQLSVGGLVASVVLSSRVLLPVDQFLGQVPEFIRAYRNWQTFGTKLDTIRHSRKTGRVVPIDANLLLKDVSFVNQHGRPAVFSAANLRVSPGEIVEVAGPSGAGKTVLANILVGARSPSSGAVFLGAHNLQNLKDEVIGRHIGYVPETPSFVAGTILENIARMAPKPDLAKAIFAAERAKAHNFIETLPEGYQTPIDPWGTAFSSGQRQLLSLSRALFENPRILILDEPGSIFEEVFSLELVAALEAFKSAGRSIIIFGRQFHNLPGCNYRFVLSLSGLTPVQKKPMCNCPQAVWSNRQD